jgi:hypothetical protein
VSPNEAAGEPISYIALEKGTKVVSAEGKEIGKVAHVLADWDDDIFEGIVIETGDRHRGYVFADAPHVGEIRSQAVILNLDAEQARSLPEPEPGPPVLETGPEDTVNDPKHRLKHKLQRAWDLITGNY